MLSEGDREKSSGRHEAEDQNLRKSPIYPVGRALLTIGLVMFMLVGAYWLTDRGFGHRQPGSGDAVPEPDAGKIDQLARGTITIDGESVRLDAPAYLIGGVVMLPMRDTFEQAGATVVYEPAFPPR